MAIYPGSPMIVPILQFGDELGHPLVGGKLFSYVAGLNTPKSLWTDVNLTVAYPNPLILDAAGTPGGVVYQASGGYKFILQDALGNEIWTADFLEDIGQTFFSTLGNVLTAGSKNVVSGYQVLSTDRFVTVSSTGGPNPCLLTLPTVLSSTQPLAIKNVGTIPVQINANGADNLDAALANFTLPLSASPVFSTVVLLPDPLTQTWWIQSYYKP